MADGSLHRPLRLHLASRAVEEFKRFIVIFFYLWIVFGLLSIHKSIVLSQRHLDVQEHTFAVINAFVFAKVLLVGEGMRLGERFSDKPLIYPILYKCFVFTLVLLCFHFVESIAVGLLRGNTIANSLPPVLGWSPKGLLAVSVVCFVLLLPFFGFREITRVIGRREMHALLFEPRGCEDGSGNFKLNPTSALGANERERQ